MRLFVVSLLACSVGLLTLAHADQNATPKSEDAERDAFQTPTTGQAGQGEPNFKRDTNPLAGSQGPATNPESKNITEPTGRPDKASPNSPDK